MASQIRELATGSVNHRQGEVEGALPPLAARERDQPAPLLDPRPAGGVGTGNRIGTGRSAGCRWLDPARRRPVGRRGSPHASGGGLTPGAARRAAAIAERPPPATAVPTSTSSPRPSGATPALSRRNSTSVRELGG